MAAFFVSDLHLTPDRPEVARDFLEFLGGRARRADALYILGDLFDYWAGDEDLDEAFNAGVAAALAALSRSGTRVLFMPGNRDFLAGERFEQAACAERLPDPVVLEIEGVRTVLTHGDQLCTGDESYQRFRRQVRDPEWMHAFLHRPLDERRQEINRLRALSRAEKSRKPADIMDVTPAAVEALLRRHDGLRLIHGHTHRQGRHIHRVDGRDCERWVLPDWHPGVQALAAEGPRLLWEPVSVSAGSPALAQGRPGYP